MFVKLEKTITNMTFRCSDDEKRKAEAISRVKKFKSPSEYLRNLLIQDIAATEEYLNSLSKEFDLSTNTLSTSFFELSPEPLPKPQAQKKPNCCNQLSLIAIHNLSNE